MIESMAPASGREYRESDSIINTADLQDEMLGGKGFVVIGDTAAHTPPTGQCFRALHCITATIFAAFVADSTAPITGSFIGTSHAAGFWLFGKFTSITLTSGDVYAYKGLL